LSRGGVSNFASRACTSSSEPRTLAMLQVFGVSLDAFSSTSARIMPQVGYPLRRSVPLAEARNISENRYTLFGIML